ncbi:MAG: AAA family ATPase, partial [Lachnospiraceae bacterium]|nr:AAA family ATPase [Lachnospiraceae bacterium]
MGTYLNPGNAQFQKAINNNPYVDKSGLLAELNKKINTNDCFVCVSRPRRFGKTMAANMLSAYYGCGSDTAGMFAGLEIENHPSFRQHLNKYNVIFLNMADMIRRSSASDMISRIERSLTHEFSKAYPDIQAELYETFIDYLKAVYEETGIGMVVIIDEWDCIFRLNPNDDEAQKDYLDFLRDFLKD